MCFKPTPLWFFVYRTSFPPVYQDPTCTSNFLYRYTSLISAASWYTGGGTMFLRYSRACSSYECFILRARRLSSKLLKQGYLAERLKSSFRKFYGRYGDLIQQYEVSLSRMLNDILILDQQWLPNQSDFPPISWPWYRTWPSPIMSGFHGAFATGVACQQGTLTLPDTWFRPPFWDLLMLQLLRPNSLNLPCLYSTFHLEYPLVLSRFCFVFGWLYSEKMTFLPQNLQN